MTNTSTIQRAINHLTSHDMFLATIISETKTRPILSAHSNYYHELISSIIGQQLSLKAAATILTRFKALFDDQFPDPELMLRRDIEDLRRAGLSYQKITYLHDLSQHVLDNRLRFEAFNSLSNAEIVTELTRVKGIGEWTAHMFLIFCMGRLDVLPTGDLGIRTGIMRLYGLETLPKPDAMRQIAQLYSWSPYESVASWYIWQSLDNAPKL